jgi:pteridine reductase
MSEQVEFAHVARQAALVTGGAIRLGKALAFGLAAAGYDIALHYNRSAADADQTAAEIRALGVSCQTFGFNLQDVAAFPNWLSTVQQAFPNLAVLVNSASAYTQASIAQTSIEAFDAQFAINVRAPFFLLQAFAQQVGHGDVINIIDNKIAFNQPQYAAYLLSKKTLAALTQLAALELAPAIRVNGIAPGVVMAGETRSAAYMAWRLQGIPLQRAGSPNYIVQAMLSLLQNEFVTGQILLVDGGESLTNSGRNAGDFDPSQV